MDTQNNPTKMDMVIRLWPIMLSALMGTAFLIGNGVILNRDVEDNMESIAQLRQLSAETNKKIDKNTIAIGKLETAVAQTVKSIDRIEVEIGKIDRIEVKIDKILEIRAQTINHITKI